MNGTRSCSDLERRVASREHERTDERTDIIVPNAELAMSAVTNRTATDPVSISYEFGVDRDEVQSIIYGVARDLDHVAERPGPTVAGTLTASSIVLVGHIRLPVERKNRVPVVRAAFVRTVHGACTAAGTDLSEDSGTGRSQTATPCPQSDVSPSSR
ncbi:hypothetical protein BRC76_07235 [Halobacteriales archaeon QH_8_67_36]|nr:MAG: hypothetical protein BRC76_07235 [Halobacteriales archaeon QH_8_67_36]